jgi:hypothetical protein
MFYTRHGFRLGCCFLVKLTAQGAPDLAWKIQQVRASECGSARPQRPGLCHRSLANRFGTAWAEKQRGAPRITSSGPQGLGVRTHGEHDGCCETAKWEIPDHMFCHSWLPSLFLSSRTRWITRSSPYVVRLYHHRLQQGFEHWSLTTLREKLVKIGAQIVRHSRCVVFQQAEVAVPRALFAEIFRRGSKAMNDDTLTGEVRPLIDRRPLEGTPNGVAHEPKWESRVKCELLHTGRPPSSDILALCRTELYGESRLKRLQAEASPNPV